MKENYSLVEMLNYQMVADGDTDKTCSHQHQQVPNLAQTSMAHRN
jgi:hypothetical protein